MHNHTFSHGEPKGARLFAAVTVTLVLAFLCSCAHASPSSFDHDKARQLSPEKRRQFDLVFFNELAIWDLNSNRYAQRAQRGASGSTSLKERSEEFGAIAKEGFLPAHVALRLFDIEHGRPIHDSKAIDVLIDSAERGDVSSMCAVGLMPPHPSILESKRHKESVARLRDRGAHVGHGACLYLKAREFVKPRLNTPDPYDWDFDLEAAKPYLLPSAAQGYYHAHRLLFTARSMLSNDGRFDFRNTAEVHRALCWGRLAQQHTNWAFFDVFLVKVRGYARAENRPDLIELISRYDMVRIPISELVVKPQDCVDLEQRS